MKRPRSARGAIRGWARSARYSERRSIHTIATTGATIADLEQARESVWRLIGEPVVFTHGGVKYPIGTEDLASALAVAPDETSSLRIENLQTRMQAIAPEVATPAQNVMPVGTMGCMWSKTTPTVWKRIWRRRKS